MWKSKNKVKVNIKKWKWNAKCGENGGVYNAHDEI